MHGAAAEHRSYLQPLTSVREPSRRHWTLLGPRARPRRPRPPGVALSQRNIEIVRRIYGAFDRGPEEVRERVEELWDANRDPRTGPRSSPLRANKARQLRSRPVNVRKTSRRTSSSR